jgi:hypothetical protein
MRKVNIKESEELQQQGWTVTGIYVEDGEKVHELEEPITVELKLEKPDKVVSKKKLKGN